MPHPARRALLRVSLVAAALATGVSVAAAKTPAKPSGAPDHPVVPGFERFHAAAPADPAKGGRLLLGELNCVSCHRPDAAREAHLLRKQAPVLDGVAGRVRRGHLRRFLADPQDVKPGTTMPNLFAGLDARERERRVEALVHFLASTGSLKHGRPETKLIARGRELYHQVGCVACHGTRDADGNPEKVLPTSVPLGDLRAKYTFAGLAAFLENPHAVRPSGRMPGILNGEEARQVANYLLRGAPSGSGAPNLTFAYYEGNWDRLPDFAKLRPRATGKVNGFDLSVAKRPGEFAVKFEGYLRIERDGNYRFHLTSDDGSKLFLDDKPAVENDGVHAPSTVSGMVRLTRGTHRFAVGVFNAGGGAELEVAVEGPGLGRQDATSLVFLTPDGSPRKPDRPANGNDDEDFQVRPELAARGRELFVSVGCANCHTFNASKKPAVPATQLGKLRPEGGCLATVPEKGRPWYALSPAQRTALAAALKAPPSAERPGPAEVIARALTTFNCYACHQRDGVGGPEDALNAAFTTTQPEMGDEGRIPPFLTGVGAKLTPAYLRHILADGSRDRPYMHTRMPKFGEANVGALVTAFAAVDRLEPVTKVTFPEPLSRVKANARHMVGGQALGCVKCHTFAGYRAEGVQGIDMLLLPRRVRRDWFHRYLLDPQKLRPGTRMPTAWINGTSVLPKVLGGDAARQIEAIWVYLSDGNKAGLPQGLNKKYIVLVPEKEAILHRNFLQGVGPRGIGVGYPEKAHLAFDANDLRLALLWQGDFLDVARHWSDRSSGFEPPLGDNVVHLPTGVAFAVLGKDSEPWPTKSARDLGYRFRGYRLSPDRRPTFLYSLGGVRVEDFPNAVADKPNPGLKRTLSLTAERPMDHLWFRAASADRIEPAGDGWYRVNGEWKVRIETAAKPKLRQVGGKTELLVPVRFQDGRARIVQEFAW